MAVVLSPLSGTRPVPVGLRGDTGGEDLRRGSRSFVGFSFLETNSLLSFLPSPQAQPAPARLPTRPCPRAAPIFPTYLICLQISHLYADKVGCMPLASLGVALESPREEDRELGVGIPYTGQRDERHCGTGGYLPFLLMCQQRHSGAPSRCRTGFLMIILGLHQPPGILGKFRMPCQQCSRGYRESRDQAP